METLSNKYQRRQIKEFIDNELTSRGFDVKIETFTEGEYGFEFESSEFQIVPAIFKSLKVRSYGGCISVDSRDVCVFLTTVTVITKDMEGRGRAIHLFDVTGEFKNGTVHKLQVNDDMSN